MSSKPLAFSAAAALAEHGRPALQCWVPAQQCAPTAGGHARAGIAIGLATLLLHVGVAALLLWPSDKPELGMTAASPVSSVRVSMVAMPPPPPPVPLEPPPVLPPKPAVVTASEAQRSVARSDRPRPKEKRKATPRPRPQPRPPIAAEKPPLAKSPPAEAAPPPAAAPAQKMLELPSAVPKDMASIGCQVPAPVYPRRARRLGLEGKTVLRLVVTAQGRIANVRVMRSSGNESLDAAAREAVQAARCTPYRKGGQALAVVAQQSISFDLNR